MNETTFQEALAQTSDDPKAYNLNPDDPEVTSKLEAAREEAASKLMLGLRANRAYWDSRSELEALRAQAEGHGEIVRGSDTPTESVGTTGNAGTIEGTAEEDHEQTALGTGQTSSAAEDKLREQLRNLGVEPTA